MEKNKCGTKKNGGNYIPSQRKQVRFVDKEPVYTAKKKKGKK